MKKLLLSIMVGVSALTCGNAQTIILTEDFEGGAVPATWSQVTAATDGGWKVGINTALQSLPAFPIDPHTNIAATNDDLCNCNKNNDILVSPVMDLTTNTNVFLSYDNYYYNLSYQGLSESAYILASIDGGTTWTTVDTLEANTGSWQTNYVDLTAFAGNANVKIGFKYSDGTGWLYGWAIDNVSVFEPVAGLDAGLSSTLVGKNDPRPVFVGYPKYITNLPLSIVTKVTNLGTVAITSFDYSWTDGVNTNNQSITGVNILPLTSYTFTATAPYLTLAGATTISTTISNINSGATELSTANNTGTFSVEGVTPHPDKRYFAEEATGTWCQWCPRGAVFMDYMKATYPNEFVGVAVHNADPMTVTAYDAGMGPLIGGYPSALSNGSTEIDPSELEGDFIDVISNAPQVTITGTGIINLATSQITVDLSGTFNTALSGDFRFMAVLVEDSVTGTATSYNQANSYGGGANGPMGGFENLAATVPAALMRYDFVARALMGGFDGQSGSIPGSVTAGTPNTYQFTAPVAATWNKSNLSVAAVVMTGTGAGRTVLNAAKFPVSLISGINDNANSLEGSYLYPTTTSDAVNLVLQTGKSEQINVTVTDMIGKVILAQDLGNIQPGTQKLTWNVSALKSGMYFLNVFTADGKVSQKFIKE